MLDAWLHEPHPWPVVPRPFAEEPIGGWLGRVAARYRMGVGELAEQHGLDLGSEQAACTWLLISAVSHSTISRLAALARVDPELLRQMQPQRAWPGFRSRLSYCARCLFLNPVDITSPRWLRAWLDGGLNVCQTHDVALRGLPVSSIHACRNFNGLLRLVSRRERDQDWYSGRRRTPR